MDCSYKTHQYNMPLLHVASVTGTDDTFSSSFAFLRNEKICEYRWALTQITRNLAGKCPPAVVVIDHENALRRALEYEWPNTAIIICRWHIRKNIAAHCKHGVLVDDWNALMEGR